MINTINPWKHKSSGRRYAVLCVADVNPKPGWHAKNTVVIMDPDGKYWTRPLADFLEKFEEVVIDGAD